MTPNEPSKTSRWECCFWVLSIFKFAPVLFILAIIVWSYYAYVVELCVFTIDSTGKKAIYLLVYHCLTFLLFWSYGQTIITKTGRIPERFQLTDSEQDRLIHAIDQNMQQIILKNIAKHLPNTNFTIHGGVRYCDRCRAMKPDRAHHCSVCGYCVLKMDHHCPWVNNCISFTNYKFFILFLAYALIYCIFVAITTLEFFFMYWKGLLYNTAKFHVLFLFFVSLMFAISLVSLFIYHCYLLRNNRSTLEAFRPAIFQSGPDKDGFNIGACANFKQVFGNDSQLWFLPIYTSLGDGIIFPHKPISEDAQELLHNPFPDECSEFNRHFTTLK